MMRTAVGFSVGRVLRAGVFGGIVFAAFEMVTAALVTGWDALFNPLRMIGAMLLGSNALDPGYSLAIAATTGFMIHMLLSVAFAILFAEVARSLPTTAGLTLVGMVFGLSLWLVNFYAIAPMAGWTWFPDRTNPVVQLLAHTFFYGCPVGWYLGTSRRVTRAAI
jgi:hypothetical protein